MISKKRLKSFTALAITVVAVPLLISACTSDNPLSSIQGSLCCTQFVVGADLSAANFNLTGKVDGQFKAFAQAGSDLAAVASASLNDVATACEGIARDVGASAADVSSVDAMTGDPAAKAKAWCTLAKATINSKFKADGDFGVTIDVEFQPPTCTASVSAQANCEASCTVDGSCTADAMVSCTGGKLPTVECTGSCEATVDAPSISCTGTCSGMCTGDCTAQADVAVDCSGKCDGDCTVDGMTGSASAIQADGSCSGKCKGTCTASGNAAVSCTGTCSGTCDAKCSLAPGSAKFECNGKCTKTDGSPPRCKGSADLNCDVSADCKANCSASVSAKAECTPPKVLVVLGGTAKADIQGQLDIAVASLESNLPQLLVVLEGRGASFASGIDASITASASLNVGDLSTEAGLCLIPIGSAFTQAVTNFGAALEGTLSVTGAVHVPDPSKT